MVSIQNPSVSVKDVWDYPERNLSNPEDLANLNAAAVLNAVVPFNPPENTVASRLRNGIVNDVNGTKDKYDIKTYFVQQHPNSTGWAIPNLYLQTNRSPGNGYLKYDYAQLINAGYDMQDIDPRAAYRFTADVWLTGSGNEIMAAVGREVEFGNAPAEYTEPSTYWMHGIIAENDTAVAGKMRSRYNITSADLWNVYHPKQSYISIPGNGSFSANSSTWNPPDNKFPITKQTMNIEPNIADINNITGDYFTNFMITLYDPAPTQLNFRLVSAGIDVTTLTIQTGSYEGHALVDNNAATVPGQTQAQIVCDTTLDASMLNPAIRRIEVSTLIPKTVTPVEVSN